MTSSSPAPGSTADEPGAAMPGSRGQAAQGPVPDAVSAAQNPAPARPADSPEAARGRRTLSTAFVMMGPDGHLTVDLRDGRRLVLRDVVMRAKDYCGRSVPSDAPGARHCGTYADVAAARPGGAPAVDASVSAAAGPIASEHRPIRPR